ncbi:envelope glycoprotein K [Falconid herpesvirus 1]|uniref:Envelope glycoprotein K n=1 Tax=Falconid herpesvirus 1 TaxID=1510155 RepID=A0A068ES43_9ALPH|nr:envelope glycoprotein K [Falconid herpesvirus 1]AID52760.1 envelope glycoprotein K [Falconid herpesvirus 1]
MTVCGSVAYATIALSLILYTGYVLLAASKLGRTGNGCVFAVIPDAVAIDAKNFTWEPLNSSLIYAPLGSREPLDGGAGDFSDVCRQALIDPKVAESLENGQLGRARLRLVVGTRNCVAYLWTTHLRFLMTSASLYALFYLTRTWRYMFGVVRLKKDRVSPSRYTGNYAVRVLANTVSRSRYTKMAAFMCELSIHRNAFNRAFVSDPITFMFANPLAAAMIVFELGLRISAQCCAVAVVTTLTIPCAAVYTLMFKALTGTFIVLIVLSELTLALRPGPAEKVTLIGEVENADKKEQGESGAKGGSMSTIFNNCCATVLSGILIRTLHLLFMVAVVVALIKYEQKIQAALFGKMF